MGMEWVKNGYGTGTGTPVEWQQSAFCQAFPVSFLLIGTVVAAIALAAPVAVACSSSSTCSSSCSMIMNMIMIITIIFIMDIQKFMIVQYRSELSEHQMRILYEPRSIHFHQPIKGMRFCQHANLD